MVRQLRLAPSKALRHGKPSVDHLYDNSIEGPEVFFDGLSEVDQRVQKLPVRSNQFHGSPTRSTVILDTQVWLQLRIESL